jgi:hypothetical protein
MLFIAPAFAQSPSPDPLQGDGRVSAFYQWTAPVVGKAGQLLNSEPLPSRMAKQSTLRESIRFRS